MAKSTAAAVSFLFAESSPENKSVHFSFDPLMVSGELDKPINIRIPANQLGALIQNLQRVQERLEDDGIDTRADSMLVPAAPHDFFK